MSLRSDLKKLAVAEPKLRADLIPLLRKHAAKPSGEGLNGYNAAVGWQDKGDERRARIEYLHAAEEMGLNVSKVKSGPLAKLQQAVKADLERRSKIEGVGYKIKNPKK